MSDAWMVVHVVGALIIRLGEQNGYVSASTAR
jgi:hypothetical protein